MPLTNDDRVLIKELRLHRGYNALRFMIEFPQKKWSKSTLNRLIAQIDATGLAERPPRAPRSRTVRSQETVEAVGELVLSQESAPGTHKSLRQIARETGVHRSSVHRIVHKDLSLKCFKRSRAQELTEANKLTRLARCKTLVKKFPSHLVPFIWFTDEKIFTVAPPINSQNDRLYAGDGTKKAQLSAARILHTRPTFSKSVMVSVGVSALGMTDLFFIEPGVKINGQYYRDVLLTQNLLPAIREISGDFFIFQQDGAPSHRAKETVQLLTESTPSFIQPTLWPPNSPDLNPVDYKVWGVLQERVYRTPIRDVAELKQRLRAEWSDFSQSIVNNAVNDWRLRLQACIDADGGHFEFRLK